MTTTMPTLAALTTTTIPTLVTATKTTQESSIIDSVVSTLFDTTTTTTKAITTTTTTKAIPTTTIPIVNPIESNKASVTSITLESLPLNGKYASLNELNMNTSSHALFKTNCLTDSKIFYTDASQNYHMNKCIDKKIAKLSNNDKCVKYMSNILSVNSGTTCGQADAASLCNKMTSLPQNVIREEAIKWCTLEQAASNTYWKSRSPN